MLYSLLYELSCVNIEGAKIRILKGNYGSMIGNYNVCVNIKYTAIQKELPAIMNQSDLKNRHDRALCCHYLLHLPYVSVLIQVDRRRCRQQKRSLQYIQKSSYFKTVWFQKYKYAVATILPLP